MSRGPPGVKQKVIRYYMAIPPAPRRKAADAYHHGDLRQALIAAALAEVERNGPEGVSLTALAKTLGVSQPAPYRHFADREALLAAVAAEGFRAFTAALKAGRARMAQAYVAFGLERNGLYRLMFASRLLAGAGPESELGSAANASFGVLLDELSPSAPTPEVQRRALRIWAALHGIVMLADQGLLPGPAPGVSLEQLVDEVIA